MIITRTPFRISLFVGGTDYPEWFSKNKGQVISLAINKYCHVTARYLPPYFKYNYRIRFFDEQKVKIIKSIRNPVVRESLNYLKFQNDKIELVHNVGGGGRWGKDNFLKTKLNVWDEVYKKNNSGLIIFTKYFLPTMIKNNWGRVIAIGSVCGIESRVEDRSWFTAAKSAQHGIIKSFSKKHQFTKKNITFNSISPGPIFIKNTGWEFEKRKNPKKFKKKIENLIPTKHIGKPEDISPLCLFLSSDHAKYINGSNFIIDGGTSNAI